MHIKNDKDDRVEMAVEKQMDEPRLFLREQNCLHAVSEYLPKAKRALDDSLTESR